MIGAKSAAIRLARAERALSAMLEAAVARGDRLASRKRFGQGDRQT
jgi:hypothetical protein